MDKLIEYYSEGCRKGEVDYKFFDQEIYDIMEGAVISPTKKLTDTDKKKEPKVRELEISVRPSPNLPGDPRYSMKNTASGRYPENRQKKSHKVKVSQKLIEEIIKATYIRDKFIEDIFIKFGEGRINVITQDSFKIC